MPAPGTPMVPTPLSENKNVTHTVDSPLQVAVCMSSDREINNQSTTTHVYYRIVHNTVSLSQQEDADKGHLFGFAACYANSRR